MVQTLYVGGKPEQAPADLCEALAEARRREGFVWVELAHPTHRQMMRIAEVIGLPAIAVDDAVEAHQRPKSQVHGDVLAVVFKPVHYVDPIDVVTVTELAVFVGPCFVVTVRHGATTVLEEVRARVGSDEEQSAFGAAQILVRCADEVVDGYQVAIDHILEDVDTIEEQVFGVGVTDRSERIYKLKREVAEFRRAVSPLGRTLERLSEIRTVSLPPETAPYFREITDHLLRSADRIEGIDRLLSDILAANTARVSVRQNEDMRKISAWAAIALVPTAIAGIYGMNFDHMPELEWRLGYPMVLAVIGATCGLLHRSFRRNNWL
ncbi:MAG: magnesium and cobalt transport protein CorA [Sporichthyaceae bacterium]